MPTGPWLPALRITQHAFADLLRTADPGAPVPACAPWTVTDLVLHLANTHRWAAGMAAGGSEDEDDAVGPRDPDALRRYYDDAAAHLRATLDRLGPDFPARTLNGPGPASFWHRRQLHETLVHLDDLATATARPQPVTDPLLWSDTVDEVVTVLTPRQLRLGRIAPLGATLTLHATDTGRRWTLGTAGPAATVTADARTLALLLWRRTELSGPELTGDRRAADLLLTAALTP